MFLLKYKSSKLREFLRYFLAETSIHGFVHVVKLGNHFIERIFWWICILIAVYGTASVSLRTWRRFQTSPIVISMDRNMFAWNTSFPSLTVCPKLKVDETKMNNYIKSHSNMFKTVSDSDDFIQFVTALSELNYENINLTKFPENTKFKIQPHDYMELIYNVSFKFGPEISSGTRRKMFLQESITEYGLCYSLNTNVAVYNSMTYWKSNKWSIEKTNETFYVHPLDGEIFFQLINLSSAYDVWFHGANEIPEISKQHHTFQDNDYTTIELLALETVTSKSAADLKITQRNCRFLSESENTHSFPVYTYNECIIECRMRKLLKECGCIPHFYRRTTHKTSKKYKFKAGESLKVCEIPDWICIDRIKADLINVNIHSDDCKCEANCKESKFFVQGFRSREWFLGANLQWGIIEYPKMQLVRDVLFSFIDVLVYIGGTAGLFLGCSLLGITEILFYFTFRFFKLIFYSRNN